MNFLARISFELLHSSKKLTKEFTSIGLVGQESSGYAYLTSDNNRETSCMLSWEVLFI